MLKRRVERRRRDNFILIERRKGRLRMFSQIALFAVLMSYFYWLVR